MICSLRMSPKNPPPVATWPAGHEAMQTTATVVGTAHWTDDSTTASAPAAPAGPVVPVAPVGPGNPVGPVAPRGPVGPAGPVVPRHWMLSGQASSGPPRLLWHKPEQQSPFWA